MRFAVRALLPDHRVETREVDAADEPAARRAVASAGARALHVTPVTAPRAGRPPAFSLVLFSQELQSLLDAGLSLAESFEALADRAPAGPARDLLGELLRRLQEGQALSDAAGAHPALFPPLYVGTLKAAERTGDLPAALGRFIDYQQRVDQLRGKLVGACIYPAILLMVGSLVTLFLLGHVVPSFAAVYQDSGRDMPLLSRWLMAWGGFASAHGGAVTAAVAAAAAALAGSVRQALRGGGLAALLRRLPGVGPQVAAMELSRLYLTLGMLLGGGIPVRTALGMAAGTLSPDTRARLAAASDSIGGGDAVSTAFERQGLVTPVALRLLRVGERTGRLGEMLERAARFHEAESARWIDRFTKAFEPALMAAIGLVIGGIVVLLYLPIFDLAGSLQ
ncbi:type II secretion system F family protein [Piscinibacter gummiphilus]|uniref:Type II secretion system protein n=1 Tax=Piscinibacter gummiphilus TaxID=946333 RepID=A0A1W6LGJ1_9BURK|nr:type II secretion system F family protein [Piscinibacter gummiphilus]ARN23330.1 type II secretion system protein [Piscinibacter gummiphilus]ATU68031.1 type II secretion system F family protein [Piscinibacter gummiphilus]GLS97328.1 type II secretion system protein [Piscinibacter gummiphilus]